MLIILIYALVSFCIVYSLETKKPQTETYSHIEFPVTYYEITHNSLSSSEALSCTAQSGSSSNSHIISSMSGVSSCMALGTTFLTIAGAVSHNVTSASNANCRQLSSPSLSPITYT